MSDADVFGDDDGRIEGVAVGIVTDNEDPENIGRVKLKFPWRDADDESYWARVATEMAGKEYGTYFLPEVGDEVLVAFDRGDIHHPYVVGSLWSGESKPPRKNKGGKNNNREIKSRSGHQIHVNDSGSEGKVRIETKKGHEIILDDTDGSEKIRIEDKDSDNTVELDSGSDEVSISAGKKISLDAKTIELKGKKEIKLKSNGTVNVSSSKTNVSSKGQLNLSSNGLMGINANGPLTLKGAIIRLN